jgi:hypothetical protein
MYGWPDDGLMTETSSVQRRPFFHHCSVSLQQWSHARNEILNSSRSPYEGILWSSPKAPFHLPFALLPKKNFLSLQEIKPRSPGHAVSSLFTVQTKSVPLKSQKFLFYSRRQVTQTGHRSLAEYTLLKGTNGEEEIFIQVFYGEGWNMSPSKLRLYGGIMLKWILNKLDGIGWTGLVCLDVGRSGMLLCTWWWNSVSGLFCYWVETESALWSYEKTDVFKGKAAPSQTSNRLL